MTVRPTVGVLALQGDVTQHLAVLERCDADGVRVRGPAELARCDALVLPGGESTTMIRLLARSRLDERVRERIAAGLPVLGTCAGLILLADRLVDGAAGQATLGGLDVTVRRNAFGHQVDSFETRLDVRGVERPVHAAFIRAPWVEEHGPDVEVLARVPAGPHAGRVVGVRQGALLAVAFHPESTGETGLHRSLLAAC